VLNGLAIRLNGERPNNLQRGPGVARAGFSALYQPTMNISPDLIGATELWDRVGGPGDAGAGIKIGIIDTGIDLSNPFLSDAGYLDTDQTDACAPLSKPASPNTSNKVIVCRVYASGVAAPEGAELLAFDHGTHVAGTAAGNHNTEGIVAVDEDTTVDISSALSGIAPKAFIGDYNVFPGFGGGFVAFDGSAFSHDIAAALEDTVRDGMHVVNMSLGGSVQGPHDFLAEAVNATVDAGLVVAVAAGNSGPGDATVESPGSAAGALTAGASTNPHFVGIPVTVGSNTFGAALGDFDNFGTVTADYTVTTPANGCSAIAEDLTGMIALIDRGVCTFTTKIRNAENAGAIGVLVVNNVAGDPSAMGHDGTEPFPTIPAAMLGKDDGNAIKSSGTASIDGTSPEEFITDNADILAGFSSRGPAPFTYLIKPDVTAPGVNVLSSVFDQEFAFFQGTSMATPHLAGSAALLLDLNPEWSPADVKSALVNTAARVVTDSNTGTVDPGVLARGGGRVDLTAAPDIPVTIDPASASFGLWKGNKPVSASLDLTLHDVSDGATCTVAVTGPDIVTASADQVSVPDDGSATLTLVLDGGRSDTTPSGDYTGDVELNCDSTTLLVPWWVRIDR
jgi:minor extracellular serine protease Vpr